MTWRCGWSGGLLGGWPIGWLNLENGHERGNPKKISLKDYMCSSDSTKLLVLYDIARLTKPHSKETFVELIWKPITLNYKLISIAPFVFVFQRYTDFNYVGTPLETHRWANIRKQFHCLGGECTRTRSQPSMRATQW
jgi:hypothetical protein